MTDTQQDNLDEQLASMTQWQGDTGDVWRSALQDSKRVARQRGGFMVRIRRNWRPLSIAASLLVVASIALLMVTNNNMSVRRYARALDHSVASAPAASPALPPPALSGESAPARTAAEPTTGAVRQIVRRATIELEVKDVRSAFTIVQHLPSMARGEFVADSSLTGSDAPTLRGNLTLRVDSSRLADVLNELRELGAVVSEKISGEDVTSQVVDLDARLRNERRIEAELLALLDNRADAPLHDVLEVRTQLNNVRLHIEQLTAQQQHLSRQVSLATVLVFLRPAPESETEPPAASNLFDHMRDAFGKRINWGLTTLIDTAAGFVGVLIGGLLWWLILLFCGVLIWTRVIRAQPARI